MIHALGPPTLASIVVFLFFCPFLPGFTLLFFFFPNPSRVANRWRLRRLVVGGEGEIGDGRVQDCPTCCTHKVESDYGN